MTARLNLLILEDQSSDAKLMLRELSRAGFDPKWKRVHSREDYEASLRPELDVILADFSLPQFNALQALSLLQDRGLDIPFIVVTGGFEEVAIDCMKAGAADYLLKDRLKRLGLSVRQALDERRLRAERRLALERANRQERLAAVGQLAAGIAPNFSSILAAIILHSEIVLGSFELSRRDEDRIRTVLKQAERGAFLTRQILDFSLRSNIEPIPVDLVQLVRELEKTLRPVLQEGIRLRMVTTPETALTKADPGRLYQALLNLTTNAQEAMPSGGELLVEVHSLVLAPDDAPPIAELPPGNWILLRIADSGRGISKVDLPHIFEPFFTTKPPDQNAGLGLSQVYGIVKQHGGHVAVSSAEGRGTRFDIYLPAMVERSATAGEHHPDERMVGKGHTILVVDDDRATREAICDLLESLGYLTLQSGDGLQAMEVVQDPPEPIDLVLSDLVMPNVGGVELFHRMRAAQIEVPLLLMTSYPLGDTIDELLDRGMVGWLEKPLTEAVLVRSLRTVLSPTEAR